MKTQNLVLILAVLFLVSCRKNVNYRSDWELKVFANGGAVKDGHKIVFMGDQIVWIGGYSNGLYGAGPSWRSTDNGMNWESAGAAVAEGGAINNMSVINDSSAFVVLDDYGTPLLKYTSNSCKDFSKVSSLPCDVGYAHVPIHFFDETTGFVGQGKTQNGGSSWDCSITHISSHYYFLNDSIGYSCSGKELLKTTDMGDTWTPIYTTVMYTYESKFFDEDNGLLLVGNELLKSSDGGYNWTSIRYNVSAFDFKDAQNGYITSGKEIHKTVDGGSSWTREFKTSKIIFLDIAWKEGLAIAVGKQLNAEQDGDYFIAISTNP